MRPWRRFLLFFFLFFFSLFFSFSALQHLLIGGHRPVIGAYHGFQQVSGGAKLRHGGHDPIPGGDLLSNICTFIKSPDSLLLFFTIIFPAQIRCQSKTKPTEFFVPCRLLLKILIIFLSHAVFLLKNAAVPAARSIP